MIIRRQLSKSFISLPLKSLVTAAAIVLVGTAHTHAVPSSELAYLHEHYTKYEYNIPMRDGVHLFTAVYVPKDDDKPYPILLTRTPYSLKPYGEDVFPNVRMGR